jgi:hypothetical protein
MSVPFFAPPLIFSLLHLFCGDRSMCTGSHPCLCIPSINFPTPEPIFTKLGMYVYIMVLHRSLPSVCVSVRVSLSVTRQRLGKHVPAATNKLINIRIVGRVVFCAILVVLKSLLVSLCVPLLLLGNSDFGSSFLGDKAFRT